MKYTKTSPKKQKTAGHVPSKLKHNNVEPGNHEIVVTEIVDASWSKKELIVGESIDGHIETSGYKDGTSVLIDIYETETNCSPIVRTSLKKTLSGNKTSFSWKYPENSVPKNSASANYSAVEAYFTIKTGEHSSKSSKIPVVSDLNIKVEKEDGTAIPNVEAVLTISNGSSVPVSTNSSGMITLKNIPPRNHLIKFTGSSRIAPEGVSVVNLNGAPKDFGLVALGSKVHVFKLIELFMYCSHKLELEENVKLFHDVVRMRRSVGNVHVFEVVPDSTGKDAYKDEVMILSRTATTLTCKGAPLKKKDDEFGMHAFELKCDQDFNSLIPNIFSGDFWKGLKEPKEYPISGLPSNLTVKCYRPDLFKLQLKFPAMRKWAGGSKVAESHTDFKNDVKHLHVPKCVAERRPAEKEGWHLNKCPKPVSSEAPIIFQRNGDDLKLDFLKTAGAVIDLGNKISSIIQTVQENVPKVGWYFEFENQLLQGTFVLEWGWKEYKDHRAYYYVGLNLDIKLIDFKMEIGFGVSGYSCKLQIFGALAGAVTVSAKLSRYSPDGEAEIGIPFGTEIMGSLGARAQAGYFIKLEGTAETGIKVEDGALKFKQHEGWSLGCSLKWTGITAKLKVSCGTAKKEGVEEKTSEEPKGEKEMNERANKTLIDRELWPSKDLGRWVWPNPDAKYTPPVMPREDLYKMILKKLSDGSDIRVKTGNGLLWSNQYMPMEEVAKKIEEKIHARNDIKKDPKTMDAVVCSIRDALVNLMDKKTGVHFAHMENQQFNNFLDQNGDLKKILNNNIDPLQDIINKYK